MKNTNTYIVVYVLDGITELTEIEAPTLVKAVADFNADVIYDEIISVMKSFGQ